MIAKPKSLDPNMYYESYIGNIPETDMVEALQNSEIATVQLINSIPDELHAYAYSEGKWTVKELFQHLIDCERILCYRALTFARKDQTHLPGFDENEYVVNDFSNQRSLEEIRNEFFIVRKGTIALFQSFSDEALDFKGVSNNVTFTPRVIGWFLVGHNNHHNQIITDRYL